MKTLALVAAISAFTNTEDVRDLAVLADGRLVAATGGGVDVFDAKGRHTATLHVEDGLPSHETWALRVLGRHLYVATSRGLIAREGDSAFRILDPRPWHGLPQPVRGDDATAYEARLAKLRDRAGEDAIAAAAFGSAEPALAFPDGRIRWGARHYLAQGRPLAIVLRSAGTLLVVTTEGAYRFGDHPSEHILEGPVAARPRIDSVSIIDRNGRSFGFDESGLRPLGASVAPHVTAFTEDGRFVGIADKGVHTRDGRRLSPKHQICSNHITDVTTYRGRVVVGSFDRGACWSRDGRRWARFRAPVIPSNIVYDVASRGRYLWVATSNGIGRYDGHAFTHYAFGGRNPFGLEALSVLSVMEKEDGGVALFERRGISHIDARGDLVERDRTTGALADHFTTAVLSERGTLWVGTEDRGLFRRDGARWKVFHDGRDLPDNWVTALAVDDRDRALVGTCQHGVALIEDGKTTVRWSSHDGLADDMVTAVAFDPSGDRAFAGTLGGLSILSGHRVVRSLGPRDGLADARVSSLTVVGSELWIGTEAGLSRLPLDDALLTESVYR